MKFRYLLVVVGLLLLDIITKNWAVANLKGKNALVVVPNFLRLTYVENRGAAFGILQNGRIFFVVLTIVVLVGIVFFVRAYKDKFTPLLFFIMAVFIAGTLGNFIDRVRYGYVVDFISLQFGSYFFPVFNVADMAITISVFLYALLTLTGRVSLDD